MPLDKVELLRSREAFNSLFEMLMLDALRALRLIKAFNSLFEMLQAPGVDIDGDPFALSILYLRCAACLRNCSCAGGVCDFQFSI